MYLKQKDWDSARSKFIKDATELSCKILFCNFKHYEYTMEETKKKFEEAMNLIDEAIMYEIDQMERSMQKHKGWQDE